MHALGSPYQSDYLHYKFEKFWEIRLYHPSNALIRCGRLDSKSKEDSSTIQTLEKVYSSNEEANYAAKKLIDIKLSKGYQYVNLEKKTSSVSINLGVSQKFTAENKDDESLKRGPPKTAFEEDLITKQIKPDPFKTSDSKTQNAEQNQSEAQDRVKNDDEFIQQEIKLNPNFKKYIIETKLKELDLFYEFSGDKLFLLGPQTKIAVIAEFLSILEPVKPEAKIRKDGNSRDSEDKKIDLSEKLDVNAKKSLYPKYWDLSEKRQNAKIRLAPESDEYRQVSNLFLDEELRECVEISKIFRIHNVQFMEKHIENIERRMQKKAPEASDRQFLFQCPIDSDVDPSHPDYDMNYVPKLGHHLSPKASVLVSESGPGYLYLSDAYVGIQQNYIRPVLPPDIDSFRSNDYYIIYDGLQIYPMFEIHFYF